MHRSTVGCILCTVLQHSLHRFFCRTLYRDYALTVHLAVMVGSHKLPHRPGRFRHDEAVAKAAHRLDAVRRTGNLLELGA